MPEHKPRADDRQQTQIPQSRDGFEQEGTEETECWSRYDKIRNPFSENKTPLQFAGAG